MAEDSCFLSIKERLKDRLEHTDDEIKAIIENQRRLKRGHNYANNLQKAIDDGKNDILAVARENLIHEQKTIEVLDFGMQPEFLKKGHYNKAFEGLAENTDYSVKAGRFSYENIKSETNAKLLNFKDQVLVENKIEKFFSDPKNERDIIDAAFKKSRGKSISDMSPDIQKSADAVIKIDKFSALEAEKAGIIIKVRQDHLWRQVHDDIIITGTKKEDWINFMFNDIKLDEAQTFGNAAVSTKQKHKFLSDVYDNIVSGEYNAQGGNFLNQKRMIHFADGESLYKYNQSFGSGNIQDAIDRSIRGTARSVATYMKFGPKPKQVLKALENEMAKEIKKLHGAAEARKFKSGGLLSKRKALIDNMLGFETPSERTLVTSGLDLITGINISSKLMKSSFSTFPDYAVAVANFASKTGAPVLESNGKILKSYYKNLSPSDRKKFGQILRINFAGELDRFGVGQGLHGKMKKFTNLSMKASLMPYLSNINKATGSHAFSSHLADNAKKSFKELHPRLQYELNNFDISKKDWEILQKSVDNSIENLPLMSPEKVETLKIKGVSDDRLFILAKKLGAFLNHQGRMSSPATGLRTRSFMNQGLNPNTVPGKAMVAFWQFKSYPIEIARVITEITTANPTAKAQGFFEGMQDLGNAKMFGLLMTEAFVMAAMGLWARDLAEGKMPRDMLTQKNMTEALSRSVLPLQFQFLVDAAGGRYKWQSFLKDLAGPVYGQTDDVMRLISKASAGDKVANDALNLWKRNMPLMQHPFVLPVVNKWFLTELSERASPGFIRRQERRMEEAGQERWVDLFSPFE